MATSGGVDDRREAGAADAAEVGDAEVAAAHVVGRELAVARLLGQLAELDRELDDALAVRVLDHRHQQAVSVSTATPTLT
jgi:hypothetical protein